jgi:hypothetical protein
MVLNKAFSKMADAFYRVGRWCEGKALRIGLDEVLHGSDPRVIRSHFFDPKEGDLGQINLLPDQEAREAVVRGYTKERRVPLDGSEAQKVASSVPQWNVGNAGDGDEDDVNDGGA